MKVGDRVKMISTFTQEGEIIATQNEEGRLAVINERDKIASVDMGDRFPVVPLALLTVVRSENPELSVRHNEGKLPIDLVPTSAIMAMASVLNYGKSKYDKRQWEKGNHYSVPYASIMRHLLAFWDGEDLDPESNLPHVEHIIMNAAMLVEYYKKYKKLDDRPNKK